MVGEQSMRGEIRTINPVHLSVNTLESGIKRIWADRTVNTFLQQHPDLQPPTNASESQHQGCYDKVGRTKP